MTHSSISIPSLNNENIGARWDILFDDRCVGGIKEDGVILIPHYRHLYCGSVGGGLGNWPASITSCYDYLHGRTTDSLL